MHRLEVSFCLSFEGRWHVGSGAGKGLVDRAVRFKRVWRDGKAVLVPSVLGSTLKGILRHSCEKIAEMLDLEWLDPHDESAAAQYGFQPISESKYIVDRLFGSRYEGECLFVEDGKWVEEANEYNEHQLYEEMIASISIDRATNTAKQDHLFSYSYLNKGLFSFYIRTVHKQDDLHIIKNSPMPAEYVLLLAGICNLNRLGSGKSTGLGMLRTEITSVCYNGVDCRESWPNYLEPLLMWGGIGFEND